MQAEGLHALIVPAIADVHAVHGQLNFRDLLPSFHRRLPHYYGPVHKTFLALPVEQKPLAMKEQALAKATPLHGRPSRYRPSDQLMDFLNGL